MDKKTFEETKIGQKVHTADGPYNHRKDGVITQKVETVWGLHCVAKFQDGSEQTIHNFSTVGIGFYKSEEKPLDFLQTIKAGAAVSK